MTEVTRGRLAQRGLQLLRVDAVRYVVARVRFAYLARRRGVRTLDAASDAVTANTVMHNLKGLTDLSVVRSSMLIRPLSVIEAVPPAQASVLAVGPRTEGELLNLFAHGYQPGRVRGLDLISYSKWIDLGDMHAMPYRDSSFDVAMLAWVLAYSDDWAAVAREVVRVTRPGGLVAVGVEHHPMSAQEIENMVGYQPGAVARLESTAAILALFGDHVGDVYFTHDVLPERRDRVGAIAVIFSVAK